MMSVDSRELPNGKYAHALPTYGFNPNNVGLCANHPPIRAALITPLFTLLSCYPGTANEHDVDLPLGRK